MLPQTLARPVRIRDLTSIQRNFLYDLYGKFPTRLDEPSFAVYTRLSDDEFAFIEDLFIHGLKAIGELCKSWPLTGLHGGGGCVAVWTPHGNIGVGDDRIKRYKPGVAGRADFAEGHDLELTAKREFTEELLIYSLRRNRQELRTAFTAPGFEVDRRCEALHFTCDQEATIGDVARIGLRVNEQNGILEYIMRWDARALPLAHSVSVSDGEWFAGGLSGINAIVMDKDGKKIGIYQGQSGFQADADYCPLDTFRHEGLLCD